MADNDLRDVITTVTTVDIQLLDANREDTTTIKLDNPKENITREQVSAAMQPALAGGWFLTNQDRVAMYLGDITVSQSIKRKLDGADFYVTPTSLTLTRMTANNASGSISVSGATIQGYNIKPLEYEPSVTCKITNNGLGLTVNAQSSGSLPAGNFEVQLVIMGTTVTVPVTVPSA